jgi:hypothetical protein
VLESERGAPQLAEWQQALREFLSELSGVAA